MINGIKKMYKVIKFKEGRGVFINLEKDIADEEKAYDLFEELVREELEYEIGEGLISDQELQNIYSNMSYRFENEKETVFLQIEEINE